MAERDQCGGRGVRRSGGHRLCSSAGSRPARSTVRLAQQGLYPACTRGDDQCQALQALVEGDPALATDRWLETGAADFNKAELPKYQALPPAIEDPAAPLFIIRDTAFRGGQGRQFVETLYQKGGWAAVNKAYENLPASTEQILHPLLIAGNLLVAWSMRDLARFGEGTPNPLAPPRRLVVEGSYALCRHPMFLGYDLVALGVVLLLGSPGMLLGTFPAMLLFEVLFLRGEERGHARRFPGRLEKYRRRVPFLMPLPVPRRGRP